MCIIFHELSSLFWAVDAEILSRLRPMNPFQNIAHYANGAKVSHKTIRLFAMVAYTHTHNKNKQRNL